MSILSLGTLLVVILVISGLIVPLRMSWRTKIILALLVIVAASKSYVYRIVGGTAYDPNIPYNLAFVMDIARSSLIFLSILVLLRLILNLLIKLIRFNKKAFLIPSQSPFYALIMVLLSFGIASYGTSSAYSLPDFYKNEIVIDKLDPRLDGMRIVLMSDIHISAPTDAYHIYEIVQKVNALNPDLILMPGDLIDGPVSKRKPLTDLLFQLKAQYGVYLSTGNHEYYSGYIQWRKYFEDGGITSLDNKVITLKDKDGKSLLNLGGLSDPIAARYNLPLPDVKGVVSALDESAPSIVLAHRPELAIPLDQSKKVDLVLSGHTHGGMIVGPLQEIVARANKGFVSGLYQLNHSKLIVCNGTMLWMGFPLRLGVPSQINVITLRASKNVTPDTQKLTADAILVRNRSKNLDATNALLEAVNIKRDEAIKEQELAKILASQDENTLVLIPQSEQAQDKARTKSIEHPSSNVSLNQGQKTKSSNQRISEKQAYIYEQQKDPIFNDLQIFLPMRNTENGQVSQNITNLVLLPPHLTQDQLSRITAIIQEDPFAEKLASVNIIFADTEEPEVTPTLVKNDNFSVQSFIDYQQALTEQNRQRYIAMQQAKANHNNNKAQQNISIDSNSASQSNQHISQELNTKSQSANTFNVHSVGEDGSINLRPQAQDKELHLKASTIDKDTNSTKPYNVANAANATIPSDLKTHSQNEIVEPYDGDPYSNFEVGGIDNETTREIQAVYGISLGNTNQKLEADGSVDELLNDSQSSNATNKK